MDFLLGDLDLSTVMTLKRTIILQGFSQPFLTEYFHDLDKAVGMKKLSIFDHLYFFILKNSQL